MSLGYLGLGNWDLYIMIYTIMFNRPIIILHPALQTIPSAVIHFGQMFHFNYST